MHNGRMYPIAARLVRLLLLLLLAALPALASDTGSIPYRWHNVVVGAGGFAPNLVFSPVVRGLAYLRTDRRGRIAGQQLRAGEPRHRRRDFRAGPRRAGRDRPDALLPVVRPEGRWLA